MRQPCGWGDATELLPCRGDPLPLPPRCLEPAVLLPASTGGPGPGMLEELGRAWVLLPHSSDEQRMPSPQHHPGTPGYGSPHSAADPKRDMGSSGL